MNDDVEQRSWFDWTAIDLQDKAKQAIIFKRMLRRLEEEGACRHVYHRLAEALFNEDMGA